MGPLLVFLASSDASILAWFLMKQIFPLPEGPFVNQTTTLNSRFVPSPVTNKSGLEQPYFETTARSPTTHRPRTTSCLEIVQAAKGCGTSNMCGSLFSGNISLAILDTTNEYNKKTYGKDFQMSTRFRIDNGLRNLSHS